MIHTISNQFLTVSVESFGAELRRIVAADGTRYLYEGDTPFWKASAPVLFPTVGKLFGGKYRYEGKEYELAGHGFARNNEFELTEHTETSMTFTLCDTPETLQRYPFRFRFDVIFTLNGDTLEVRNRVANRTEGPMYFSLGAHEGYNCPLAEGESFTDYDIIFEQPETVVSQCIDVPTGLRTGESNPLLDNSAVLPLKYDYFETDAIVLTDLKSRAATLKSRVSGRGVEVRFPDFPMLGIWQKPGASYICIEPWCGVCDFIGFDGDLTQKAGIMCLETGETYENIHTIRPF